jgi:hypothetical protein
MSHVIILSLHNPCLYKILIRLPKSKSTYDYIEHYYYGIMNHFRRVITLLPSNKPFSLCTRISWGHSVDDIRKDITTVVDAVKIKLNLNIYMKIKELGTVHKKICQKMRHYQSFTIGLIWFLIRDKYVQNVTFFRYLYRPSKTQRRPAEVQRRYWE